MVKNLPVSAGGTRNATLNPGLEDALKEGIATHSRQ